MFDSPDAEIWQQVQNVRHDSAQFRTGRHSYCGEWYATLKRTSELMVTDNFSKIEKLNKI